MIMFFGSIHLFSSAFVFFLFSTLWLSIIFNCDIFTFSHSTDDWNIMLIVHATNHESFITFIFYKIRFIHHLIFQDDFTQPLPGIYTTYIYAVLMTACIAILGFYALMTVQIHSVTISNPSLSDFEMLYKTYSETLHCPCSRLTILHDKMFILPDPVYHQVKLFDCKLTLNIILDTFEYSLMILFIEIMSTTIYLLYNLAIVCHFWCMW